MKLHLRLAASIAAMLVVAACMMPPGGEDADTRAVTGSLVLPEEADLAEGAEMVVTFRGVRGGVLAEERRRVGDGESPHAFHLLVPTDRVGAVVGRVESGDRTAWQSVSVLLDEGTRSADLGRLALDPVEAGFTPAAAIGPDEAPEAELGEEVAQAAEGTVPADLPEPGAEAAPPAPEGSPIRLACGESEITVTEAGGGADLRVGEVVVEMAAAEASGGGRRYAVPDDPATYVSLDGDAAEVSLAGAVFPDCTRVGSAQ